MAYEYIKRMYPFDPQIGKRVRHTVTGKEGVICRESGANTHYVQVRFDGKNFRSDCHPMELEYVQPQSPNTGE